MIFPQKQKKYLFSYANTLKKTEEPTQKLKCSFHVKDQGFPQTMRTAVWK